ncbi:MAG: isochorismate synthase, partial [Chloroflexi bacterium]|nr:isochorismate synthase [Chloroflexota bacterium]
MTTSLQEGAIAERLMNAFKEAFAAETANSGELVSVTLPLPRVDPVTLFEAAVETDERTLWEQPSRGSSMVAVGVAAQITAEGPNRFEDVATAWRRMAAAAVASDPGACPVRAPVGLGGFAFAAGNGRESAWGDFPEALLMVPRLLFVSQGDLSWLIASTISGEHSDPQSVTDELSTLLARAEAGSNTTSAATRLTLTEAMNASEWKSAVAAIVNEIESTELRKLVLARHVHASSDRPLRVGAALRRLRSRYQSCTTFAFARGESCFIGATPERLVRLDDRTVRIDCLAGTAARGANETEDAALGEALLADKKERSEHALVVEALRETLAPISTALSIPARPRLLAMANVQHLHTPVQATLADGQDVLGLTARLHPTPAAGGVPQRMACDLIGSYEPFDRGWYAGPVGWTAARGEGEFSVAI